jgi:hypothetical protein
MIIEIINPDTLCEYLNINPVHKSFVFNLLIETVAMDTHTQLDLNG